MGCMSPAAMWDAPVCLVLCSLQRIPAICSWVFSGASPQQHTRCSRMLHTPEVQPLLPPASKLENICAVCYLPRGCLVLPSTEA